MTEPTTTETISLSGDQLLARVKQLIHEGNVRRIVIKHAGHTVLELPLSIGVVGALLAPPLAAVGALAALVTECTIEVQRAQGPAEGEAGAPQQKESLPP